MLFSIIVPAYNVEKYIEECLESIREQSFIDFECIVVNDGSVDDTKRIVEKYAAEDSRFRIINKANGGLVSARKAGCTAAQGSYVLNVDGDDFIARDWLETIAGCILTNGEPDVIALGYTTWFKDGKSVPMRNHFTDGLYLGDHLELIKRNFLAFPREKNLYGIVYSLCCKAVKRELLVIYQLAVLDDLSIGEDVAVTFPLFLNVNSVVICNYCGYYYRQSTLSLMHSEKARSVDEMHQLFRYLTHWTSEEDEMQLGLSCYFRCISIMVVRYRYGGGYKKETVWMRENLFSSEEFQKIKGISILDLDWKYRVVWMMLRIRFYFGIFLLCKMKNRMS